MTKRFGFTLAEVLITLGIIGVVAAMTIPTLISNTNGAQFKTAYKKALSTLNQAVLMNVAMEDTDFAGLKADADGSVATGSMSEMLGQRMQSATEITDNYFTATAAGTTLTLGEDITCTAAGVPDGRCTGTETIDETTDYTATTAKVFSFADGTSFGYLIASTDCSDTAPCKGFIDVNGATGPNKEIDCADENSCTATEIMDIFPVLYHGQTVEPATSSARAVLFGK